MDDPNQPNLPLDERFRQAEQYALDLPDPTPRPEPPKLYADTTCGKTGFCYCPKCNPR